MLVPSFGLESEKCPEEAVEHSNWFYLDANGDWTNNDHTVKINCI